MTEIERIMNSSYYTVILVNRLGERVARSAFAFDAEAVRQWVKPGEKVLGIFSQSKEKAWTVCN
mgnify:CR=1 FL=1